MTRQCLNPPGHLRIRGSILYSYVLLYCTIFYHTILYYTILYYTILYYTILYYTILYYTILYYTILYYTILYYTILYYTILYYTILYYTINIQNWGLPGSFQSGWPVISRKSETCSGMVAPRSHVALWLDKSCSFLRKYPLYVYIHMCIPAWGSMYGWVLWRTAGAEVICSVSSNASKSTVSTSSLPLQTGRRNRKQQQLR